MTTYYVIKLTDGYYYDGDRFAEPVTRDLYKALRFRILADARDVCEREQKRWPNAETIQIALVEVQPEPVKTEPVADSEIASVLSAIKAKVRMAPCGGPRVDISTAVLDRWHDTLQSLGAEVVTLRESLEQCKMELPEGCQGSVPQGIRWLREELDDVRKQAQESRESWLASEKELADARESLEQLREEREDARHTRELYSSAVKDRDEAREKLEELERANYKAWSALPHDVKVRGGYLAGRIGDLVKERDEAREQADKGWRRVIAAEQERDALRDKIARKVAYIAKALEV